MPRLKCQNNSDYKFRGSERTTVGLGTVLPICSLSLSIVGGNRMDDLRGFSPSPESNGGRVSVRTEQNRKDKEPEIERLRAIASARARRAVAIIGPVKLAGEAPDGRTAAFRRGTDWLGP